MNHRECVIKDKCLNKKGFTLIELMIVVSIVGILSTIAIPNYIGMQKKARTRSLVVACSSTRGELHNWMATVASRESESADFEGDGDLDAGDDAVRPVNLAAIPAAWYALHTVGAARESTSPFFSGVDLFSSAAAPGSGQIAISCPGQSCRIRGFSNNPADGAIFDEFVGAVE